MAYSKRIVYESGQKYYNYTILEPAIRTVGKGGIFYSRWKCLCDCGNEFITTTKQIKRGIKKSCGCLSKSTRFKCIEPELVMLRIKLNSCKSGAKRRGQKWELSEEQSFDLFKSNCHYCGSEPTKTYCRRNVEIKLNGIDRVDSALHYSIDNVVPCCFICNRAKGDMPVKNFIDWIKNLKKYYEDNNNK